MAAQVRTGDRLLAEQKRSTYFARLKVDVFRHYEVYLLFIPVIAYYIIFHYIPIYGAVIAFQEYTPALGITGSKWVGFEHFITFFTGRFFWRLIRNTVLLSLYMLVFGFPLPILMAILVNEIKNKAFSRTVQTISYMPHFISTVVLCGMITQFTKATGFITTLLSYVGFAKRTMLGDPALFRSVYVVSAVWQQTGWDSIIYLAALAGIDPQLYEAAKIDGASRFKQTIHVTLPGILPTVIVLFILRIGRVLNIGSEKVLLLYNPGTYSTADVISTYVYRTGILNASWSFGAAIGLFNSVINFLLLISFNKLSKLATESSLW